MLCIFVKHHLKTIWLWHTVGINRDDFRIEANTKQWIADESVLNTGDRLDIWIAEI